MLAVAKLDLAFNCLICERFVRVAHLSGIEDSEKRALPIKNCPYCGPVDFEVMQLCREVVTGCKAN